ncbi:MAG TPA: transposase [Trebonia sp.]
MKPAKSAADRRRSRTLKRLPKLSLAVAASCHLILAARATTGAGSDHPHVGPLLDAAWARAQVAVVVADAGYDSEANHERARDRAGVASVIPPTIGRPTDKAPTGPHRAAMRERFDAAAAAAADGDDTYGQRWQVETVNSMLKRNLGSACRATTARRRSYELLLRCITHNIMVLEGTEP